ncbi:MAG: hypothetical protein R2824_15880 [Saprospiraceae bacterium]
MKRYLLLLIYCVLALSTFSQSRRLTRLPDAEVYDNTYSGSPATTKQAFLDSLAGFQSFSDLTSIQAASPRVGYTLEDRATGRRYKVRSDTIAGLPVDDSYQLSIGNGKYLVVSNEYLFSITDQSTTDLITTSLLHRTRNVKVDLSLSPSAGSDRYYQIPSAAALNNQNELTISVEDLHPDHDYYLYPPPGGIDLGDGRRCDLLYLQGTVSLYDAGTTWKVKNVDYRQVSYLEDISDFSTKRFHRGQTINYNGFEYRVMADPVRYSPRGQNLITDVQQLAVDQVAVKTVKDAAPWGRQLVEGSIKNANASLADSLSGGGPPPVAPDGISHVRSYTNATATLLDESFSSASTLRFDVDETGLAIGDTVSWTIRYSIGQSSVNNSVKIYPCMGGINEGCFYSIPDTSGVRKWEQITRTWTLNSTTNLRPFIKLYLEPGDTVYFTSPSLNKGAKAIDYRATFNSSQNDSGILYAVLQDHLSEINVDRMAYPPGYSDADQVQYAFDLCASLANCQTVSGQRRRYIDKPLFMPSGINLECGYRMMVQGGQLFDNSGTTWFFDLKDGTHTQSGITCYNQYDNNNYTTNRIAGLRVVVMSEIDAAIDVGLPWLSNFEDIAVLTADAFGNEYTYTDSLMRIGITDSPGSDGFSTLFDNVFVQDGYEDGFYFGDSKMVTMNRCYAVSNWRGIHTKSTGIYGKGLWIENNASSGIKIDIDPGRSGVFSFMDSYFESNTTVDLFAHTIDIDEAASVLIQNTRLAGVTKPQGSFIKVRNTGEFHLQDMVSKGFQVDTFLNINCSNGAVLLENVSGFKAGTSIHAYDESVICDNIIQYINLYNPVTGSYETKLNRPPTNTWGTASGTTDANGDLLITHGLTSGGAGIAPDNIKITNLDLSGNLTFIPHTITTTSFLVRCKDATTGTAVVSGAVSLMWEAKAKAE